MGCPGGAFQKKDEPEMAVGVHQEVDLAHSGAEYTFFLHTACSHIMFTYRRDTGPPSLEKYSADLKGSHLLLLRGC